MGSRMSWEGKKIVWERYSLNDSTQQTIRFLESIKNEEYPDQMFHRDTIEKVRQELLAPQSFYESDAIRLVSEIPKIRLFLERIRPDLKTTFAKQLDGLDIGAPEQVGSLGGMPNLLAENKRAKHFEELYDFIEDWEEALHNLGEELLFLIQDLELPFGGHSGKIIRASCDILRKEGSVVAIRWTEFVFPLDNKSELRQLESHLPNDELWSYWRDFKKWIKNELDLAVRNSNIEALRTSVKTAPEVSNLISRLEAIRLDEASLHKYSCYACPTAPEPDYDMSTENPESDMDELLKNDPIVQSTLAKPPMKRHVDELFDLLGKLETQIRYPNTIIVPYADRDWEMKYHTENGVSFEVDDEGNVINLKFEIENDVRFDCLRQHFENTFIWKFFVEWKEAWQERLTYIRTAALLETEPYESEETLKEDALLSMKGRTNVILRERNLINELEKKASYYRIPIGTCTVCRDYDSD